jgi:4-hydroxy-3-methylbut-2-enyl diphosphate reductase
VTGELVVFAALRLEQRALARGLPGGTVRRTGMGPARAAVAARRLSDSTPGAIAIAGVCGAVAPGLEPGDVVVATEVRDGFGGVVPCQTAPLLAAAVRRAGLPVHTGPVQTVPRVFGGSRARLAAEGVLAVDMEGAPLARAGTNVPFAWVRVVVDTPKHRLLSPRTLRTGATALRRLTDLGPPLRAWADAAGPRTVLLAAPRSFCAGVERAIDVVEEALDRYGAPIYVRKQIVHNAHVVRELSAKGAVFVDELAAVPAGATVVFSAHGVSPAVRDQADERRLDVIDATCPLVSKVHAEARRFARRGDTVLLVGHQGHEEVEGTLGEAPESIVLVTDEQSARTVQVADPDRVSYLTQTTLSVDEADRVVDVLRQRFPALAAPPSDDICYATTNRQEAVRAIARRCDLLLVLGSTNSSNSLRLVEVAEADGCPARLVDDIGEVDPGWLAGVRTLGLTAGASAPPDLVDRVIDTLSALGPVRVDEVTVATESIRFALPKEVS